MALHRGASAGLQCGNAVRKLLAGAVVQDRKRNKQHKAAMKQKRSHGHMLKLPDDAG